MARVTALRAPAPTIVGLLLALGWPLLFFAIPGQAHQDIGNASQDIGVLVMEWLATLAVAAIIIYWERLPLASSVGLRKPRWMDAAAAILAVVATFIALAAVFGVLHARGGVVAGGQNAGVFALPFGLRLGLVLTAGICEEFLFRGYAIERLTSLTGNVWAGALAAVVFFTLGHIPRYGFSGGLLGVAVIAVFLSLLYVWRRALWPCVAMHWIIDGVPLLVLPLFVHR